MRVCAIELHPGDLLETRSVVGPCLYRQSVKLAEIRGLAQTLYSRMRRKSSAMSMPSAVVTRWSFRSDGTTLPLSSFEMEGLEMPPILLASRSWLSRLSLRMVLIVAPIRWARCSVDRQA